MVQVLAVAYRAAGIGMASSQPVLDEILARIPLRALTSAPNHPDFPDPTKCIVLAMHCDGTSVRSLRGSAVAQ